jgi:F420H(2)-dependent quinone reductase
MHDDEIKEINRGVIDQFRAGHEVEGFDRTSLILLTTVDIKTGRPRTTPLTIASQVDDRLLVVAANLAEGTIQPGTTTSWPTSGFLWRRTRKPTSVWQQRSPITKARRYGGRQSSTTHSVRKRNNVARIIPVVAISYFRSRKERADSIHALLTRCPGLD